MKSSLPDCSIRRAERLCWCVAIVLLLPIGAVWLAEPLLAASAEKRFEMLASSGARASESLDTDAGPSNQVPGDMPQWEAMSTSATPNLNAFAERSMSMDFSLWSDARRRALSQLSDGFLSGGGLPTAQALLNIPRVSFTVPVYSGVDEFSMTAGAGHLPDSDALDGNGNIAITSHRDGPFRVLKDLRLGDELILTTPEGARTFRITERLIVEPSDVYVLNPRSVTTLTLITCYPFYFVGKAPQRAVFHAALIDDHAGESDLNRPTVNGVM